jgi:hypothetical protein
MPAITQHWLAEGDPGQASRLAGRPVVSVPADDPLRRVFCTSQLAVLQAFFHPGAGRRLNQYRTTSMLRML